MHPIKQFNETNLSSRHSCDFFMNLGYAGTFKCHACTCVATDNRNLSITRDDVGK